MSSAKVLNIGQVCEEQRGGQDIWNSVNKSKKGGGKLKLVSDHIETETFQFHGMKNHWTVFSRRKK